MEVPRRGFLGAFLGGAAAVVAVASVPSLAKSEPAAAPAPLVISGRQWEARDLQGWKALGAVESLPEEKTPPNAVEIGGRRYHLIWFKRSSNLAAYRCFDFYSNDWSPGAAQGAIRARMKREAQ